MLLPVFITTAERKRCLAIPGTCEADSLASCGYVYIAIYPTPARTA
ncbi:type IV toxin-antitoxin system YeeU family antitoxin [Citrobacter amalonaticus]